MPQPALLVLRDGTTFSGISCASTNNTVGEIVFNTAMTGYQEILTDPSYASQCITFTYPHIGNTGINDEDNESDSIHACGAIIRSPSLIHSNYRSKLSFTDWMKKNNRPVIATIDTRAITRHIRTFGAQDGAIVSYENNREQAVETAKQLLQSFSGLKNTDLAKQVTTSKPYSWINTSWNWGSGYAKQKTLNKHIVVYDFGVKKTILRLLADRHCQISVVPAITSAAEVVAMNPDGVLLSNGPGDPQPCTYAIESIKLLLSNKIPIFGICLGFQLLALALGGKSKKMKFGHHGSNHPVQNIQTGRVSITSQNHGFEVDTSTLNDKIMVTHKSLFDGSLQGFTSLQYPAMGFQGHPEASPGPKDIEVLFDEFIEMIVRAKTN